MGFNRRPAKTKSVQSMFFITKSFTTSPRRLMIFTPWSRRNDAANVQPEHVQDMFYSNFIPETNHLDVI